MHAGWRQHLEGPNEGLGGQEKPGPRDELDVTSPLSWIIRVFDAQLHENREIHP
jgi:hypothetical protein